MVYFIRRVPYKNSSPKHAISETISLFHGVDDFVEGSLGMYTFCYDFILAITRAMSILFLRALKKSMPISSI